jgi:predicted enzyme related to lactoylglutathione lyase
MTASAVIFDERASQSRQMGPALSNPVVHLELRTTNLSRACAFYTRLFDWSVEAVRAGPASYLAVELGEGIQGGVVECESEQPSWLPYVEVHDIAEATERGRMLGGALTLEPREGPAGWRSVLAVPAGARSRCGNLRSDGTRARASRGSGRPLEDGRLDSGGG